MGSILWCPHLVTEGVARHVFVLLLLRIKRRGLIILIGFILSTSCHHTSCIAMFVMNLIRREASIEALSKWGNRLDAESFRSTCHRRNAYVLIMP